MQYIDYLADCLPHEPSCELEQWIDKHCGEDLGGHMLLFARESIEVATEDLKDTMMPEDMEKYLAGIKHKWAARCTCTHCGEDFFAGYFKDKYGGRNSVAGIYLAQGEDGLWHDGYIDRDSPDSVFCVQVAETDHISCPRCDTDVMLVRAADIRSGRTYQIAVQSVENIGKYTALITWMASRKIDSYGFEEKTVKPREALIIDRDGCLHRFCHTWYGMYGERDAEYWRPVKLVRDGMQVRYYNYDAANHRQIGGYVYTEVPELAGTTGEKTAIEAYIAEIKDRYGAWPGIYLQTWAKKRNVENLMRSQWASAIMSGIDAEQEESFNGGYGGVSCEAAKLSWVSWRETKPHRMMHMSKNDMRAIRASKSVWNCKDAELWDIYRHHYADGAAEFDTYLQMLGASGLRDIVNMDTAGWDGFSPKRVAAYVQKQGAHGQGAQFVEMLIDYRKMLAAAGWNETEETLWPRDIRAAHDRVMMCGVTGKDGDYAKAFARAYEEYNALEWTDGELCIRLPRTNGDLIREGNVLRHCVGGYGKQHTVEGKPIFFVRHYRRPERSYYTLNIDMNGSLPREIQLHGYGNESHGIHKQCRHSIPKKVRDFCDRWEREVLTPWFAEQRKQKKQTSDKRRSA